MVALQIDEKLAEKLESLAKAEGEPVQALLEKMVEHYTPTSTQESADLSKTLEDMEALIGMSEADVDDLSVRAREYLHYFQGNPTASGNRPKQNMTLEAAAGIFDDDITDLSETIDQSIHAHLQRKFK